MTAFPEFSQNRGVPTHGGHEWRPQKIQPSDSHYGYDGLKAAHFVHETVKHMQEYVRGEVHTQGIENFWSLLKRGLNGTYVAVEPFHLDRYVTGQVFR